ncbi:tripartite tricarboxylate transporter TctB family protein [Pelobacter seleniigenes]|uniref:tripartite tricarboxylate transporter TctB family protein n=1 Tax=Pelobacter seleniigenes TaxID=407188 RepID=UPI0004A7499B|nr:tripartite tricarboxylate transporter TctB family protein [Pelobacter seleniigenes]
MAGLVYDCIFSVLLFSLGIYVAISSSDFINKKSHYVEIVYWCLLFIAVVNLILAIHKLVKQKYDKNSKFTFSKKLTAFSIITILFTMSVNYFGFYIPAVIFVFICSSLIRNNNKIIAFVVSILIVTLLNVIFSHFLNIEFPKGIFADLTLFR